MFLLRKKIFFCFLFLSLNFTADSFVNITSQNSLFKLSGYLKSTKYREKYVDRTSYSFILGVSNSFLKTLSLSIETNILNFKEITAYIGLSTTLVGLDLSAELASNFEYKTYRGHISLGYDLSTVYPYLILHYSPLTDVDEELFNKALNNIQPLTNFYEIIYPYFKAATHLHLGFGCFFSIHKNIKLRIDVKGISFLKVLLNNLGEDLDQYIDGIRKRSNLDMSIDDLKKIVNEIVVFKDKSDTTFVMSLIYELDF